MYIKIQDQTDRTLQRLLQSNTFSKAAICIEHSFNGVGAFFFQNSIFKREEKGKYVLIL